MLLSANEIRTYCDCARKRYFSSRSLMGLKTRKPNTALLLGSKVHEWLEFAYEQKDKEFTVTEMEQDLLKRSGDLAILETIQRNYQETVEIDLTKYRPIEFEHHFQLDDWPIKGVSYHGYIDMIATRLEDGAIVFFEHKTCRDFRPEIYNRFDIQLHIYDAYGYKMCQERGEKWGGMILNQLKKARTDRGYAYHRMFYLYGEEERADFFNWLQRKTIGATSPHNFHEPCNSYMTCKMCDYAPICLKYGYQLPTDINAIIEELPEEEYYQDLRDDSPKEE